MGTSFVRFFDFFNGSRICLPRVRTQSVSEECDHYLSALNELIIYGFLGSNAILGGHMTGPVKRHHGRIELSSIDDVPAESCVDNEVGVGVHIAR